MLLHAQTLAAVNLGSGEMSARHQADAVGTLGLGGVIQGYAPVSDGGAVATNALAASAPIRYATG